MLYDVYADVVLPLLEDKPREALDNLQEQKGVNRHVSVCFDGDTSHGL
jgi:hypothetical protein